VVDALCLFIICPSCRENISSSFLKISENHIYGIGFVLIRKEIAKRKKVQKIFKTSPVIWKCALRK
jgi:hypothetical protein